MIELTIDGDLAARLDKLAAQREYEPEFYARLLLEEAVAAVEAKPDPAAWLEKWIEEIDAMPEEEFIENAEIMRSLDENRMSDRKLFEGYSK